MADTKFRMFHWVPDGIYDHREFYTRYRIVDGAYITVAQIQWIEDNEKKLQLPEDFRLPWGTYPDMPPKPPKKEQK
jgi:hypothetical protein